jgi:hypothetical protein
LQNLIPAKIFDNHAAIDFAKTVFDFGAPGFWELVHAIRVKAVDMAAQHNIPVLIYTSCYSEPEDRPLFEQIEATITGHAGVLLPVFLQCPETTREQRVSNPDRVERRKITSAEGLRKFNAEWNVSPVPHDNCLHLNSGEDGPETSAAKIVKHFGLNPSATP